MAEESGKEDTGELLTPQKISKKLSVSPTTVRRLIARGMMPALRIGKLYRVRRSAFKQFLCDHVIGKEKD